QYLDELDKADSYDPAFLEFWKEHGPRVNKARHSLGGLKSQLGHRTRLAEEYPARTKKQRANQWQTVTNIQEKLDKGAERLQNELLTEGYDEATMAKILEHTFRNTGDLAAAKEALPLA